MQNDQAGMAYFAVKPWLTKGDPKGATAATMCMIGNNL